MNPRHSPCPICGQSSYSWGELAARNLDYNSEDDSWLAKSFTLNSKLPARHCDNCGNIQIFSERPAHDETDR